MTQKHNLQGSLGNVRRSTRWPQERGVRDSSLAVARTLVKSEFDDENAECKAGGDGQEHESSSEILEAKVLVLTGLAIRIQKAGCGPREELRVPHERNPRLEQPPDPGGPSNNSSLLSPLE